jgi:hypothetical protein
MLAKIVLASKTQLLIVNSERITVPVFLKSKNMLSVDVAEVDAAE